ncbi:hypothetical protein C8R47DRAFT_1281024 [Mycena vitilis]|nr:hypothetical protein C8R47DRAFT_1281024 [Mycena vitilis]
MLVKTSRRRVLYATSDAALNEQRRYGQDALEGNNCLWVPVSTTKIRGQMKSGIPQVVVYEWPNPVRISRQTLCCSSLHRFFKNSGARMEDIAFGGLHKNLKALFAANKCCRINRSASTRNMPASLALNSHVAHFLSPPSAVATSSPCRTLPNRRDRDSSPLARYDVPNQPRQGDDWATRWNPISAYLIGLVYAGKEVWVAIGGLRAVSRFKASQAEIFADRRRRLRTMVSYNAGGLWYSGTRSSVFQELHSVSSQSKGALRPPPRATLDPQPAKASFLVPSDSLLAAVLSSSLMAKLPPESHGQLKTITELLLPLAGPSAPFFWYFAPLLHRELR